MDFNLLLILGGILLVLVRLVNKKLNAPMYDDTPYEESVIPEEEPVEEPGKPTETPIRSVETPDTPVEAPKTAPIEQPLDSPSWIKKESPVIPQASYQALYGLIGKPLGHSTSKVWFNKLFREQHIDAHYDNYELDNIETISELVEKTPNLNGFNVTIPYKEAIIPYLDTLDDNAQAIGAVNVVKVTREDGKCMLKGYNTDWIGFTESFKEQLMGRHKALILGTGGVAKAVRFALDKMGIESIFVSRNSTFEVLGYYELSPSVIEEYDVIVNCTPLGMWPQTDHCPDVPYTFISEQHLLLDVIANPEETLFMTKGREHGATVQGGKDMLVQQAVAAWNIWNKNV